MHRSLRPSDLEAYLDESLPPPDMARIEQTLRDDPALVRQLAAIHARRDAGVHTLGEIWRRHRITCPTREQLGASLLGAMSEEMADYVTFHVQVVGCRYCLASLADLKRQQAEAPEVAQSRRRKFFQSSAGYLRRG